MYGMTQAPSFFNKGRGADFSAESVFLEKKAVEAFSPCTCFVPNRWIYTWPGAYIIGIRCFGMEFLKISLCSNKSEEALQF